MDLRVFHASRTYLDTIILYVTVGVRANDRRFARAYSRKYIDDYLVQYIKAIEQVSNRKLS